MINLTPEQKEKLKKIKVVAVDVDGVLTDGGMYYTESGDVMKKFSARDGMSLKMMRDDGLKVAIITGEENQMVVKRAEKLKIEEVYLNSRNKIDVATRMLEKLGHDWDELMYVGDDWLDVDLLKKAAFSFAPADAMSWAKEAADYVCERKGGEGVAGEMYAVWLSGQE